jgi:hypothetical protein
MNYIFFKQRAPFIHSSTEIHHLIHPLELNWADHHPKELSN